jgi:hypothetical protein
MVFPVGRTERVPGVRRLAAWAIWWIVCWCTFQWLSGDWNAYEWIGGACVATVAATLAVILGAAARVEPPVVLGPLKGLPSALAMIFVDFGLLLVALVRRGPGAYVVRDAQHGGPGEQAMTVWVSGFSPNAYVVEIDEDRGTVLLHDVIPNRNSEKPA